MTAKAILAEIMQFRRSSESHTACVASPCEICLEPHLSKVASAVERGEPAVFVLPAFPGKSPNPAKVFGPLPDMAERHALEFLQRLCDRIERFYPPGARIILCSDGRVFSDVVGMRDEDVTAYQEELSKMIADSGLTSISTFNLEELYKGLSFDQMRSQLMEQYGESIDFLKASMDDQEQRSLYCGITRFLFEDAMFPGQTRSRTSIQKECRIRSYEVIQRSQAWSELIEERFADAVRLSIHPQSCGAKKLGIRLSDSALGPDGWQTPWHGVAVDVGGRFALLKRSQAEALGARLITRQGRPSHYVLTEKEANA
jgi:L-tyrosine isonitrile synthase